MLTDTDIHYLVGLLVHQFEDGNIDVELGTPVIDDVTGRPRDVDVTVTCKRADGTTSAFKGIEVKHEARPLTVEHVEQLVTKFNDLSKITYRAIVSSSGYSKQALKKASHHGVDTLKLTERRAGELRVGRVQFGDELGLDEIYYEIVGPWRFELEVPSLPEPHPSSLAEAAVVSDNGTPFSAAPTVKDLAIFAEKRTLGRLAEIARTLKPDETRDLVVHATTEEPVFLECLSKRHPIVGVSIIKRIRCRAARLPVNFKALTRAGDDTLFVACMVAEARDRSLIGVSTADDALFSFKIDLSDRLKEKIRRHKLPAKGNAP